METTATRPTARANTGQSSEARLANEIAGLLHPRTVLEASGSDLFATELAARHANVTSLHGSSGVPQGARFDLITCIPAFGEFELDTIARIDRFSDQILFMAPTGGRIPILAWLTNFAVSGFAPDIDFHPGALGTNAVLLKRGAVWPPDALQLFADSMHMRDLAQRIIELETELSVERRLSSAQGGVAAHSASGSRLGDLMPPMAGVDPFALAGQSDGLLHGDISARIDGIERSVAELNRANEIVNARIDTILASRTWRIFTGLGGLFLRFAGRKAER